MILTIALVAYAVCAVVSARMLAGHLAWKWKSQLVEKPEMLDWLTAGILGVLGGLVWPVFLLRDGVSRLTLPAAGAEKQARLGRRTLEREQEIEQEREHLAELERETGLAESDQD